MNIHKPIKVNCGYCEQPFLTRDREKKYCNDECECRNVIHDRSFGSRIGEKLDLKTNKTCAHCGIKFHSIGYRKYCDGICGMASEYFRMEQSKTKNCFHCGKEFKHANEKYCSDDCRITVKKIYQEKETVKERKESMKNPKERSRGNRISYDELNRRAEIKRLEEEWAKLVK